MTTSLPSKQVYIVDVPEIQNFEATFQYNYFTPDESTNALGGTPDFALQTNSDDFNTQFVQYATTRVPRYVQISFKPVRLSDLYNKTYKSTTIGSSTRGKLLISNNLDKIINEDDFASLNFTSVLLQDVKVDDKLHKVVSSSLAPKQTSNHSLSIQSAVMSSFLKNEKSVEHQFIQKTLNVPQRLAGVRFFNESTSRKHDVYFDKLKSAGLHAQLNTSLFYSDSEDAIDLSSQFAEELISFKKKLGKNASKLSNTTFSHSDYKTNVPYVEVKKVKTSDQVLDSAAEILGYIIDKYEISSDGNISKLEPIVIENSHVNLGLDFKVRYGATYQYTIRSIALYTTPAIDDHTGDVATIKLLVSSKPSAKVVLTCVDVTAPPPPADLKPTWDYEKDRLALFWSLPVNSQRDIKRFQIFRRKNISESFELLKQYDFDDSLVKAYDIEEVDSQLTEYVNSPKCWFIDNEFDRNSSFIYALCSIDAHGFTSAYSVQFQCSFDVLQNRIVVKQISHSGAPKAYPNFYIENEVFANLIRVSGDRSKTMKVFFNPEHYQTIDDSGRITKIVQSESDGAKYVFQFVNTDSQKSSNLSVIIEDKTTDKTKKTLEHKLKRKLRLFAV